MQLDYKNRELCALCQTDKIERVINFGKTPLANSYLLKKNQTSEIYPLTLSLCKSCGHLQLNEIVSPKKCLVIIFMCQALQKY